MVDWLKLPLDVIWKHQMGERYWTWGRLIGITFTFKIPLFIIGSIMTYNKPPPPTGAMFKDYIAIEGFIVVMWIFGVANLIEISNRRKRGIQSYSYFWGTPRFFPDKAIVHCFVIPLCSAGIATAYLWLYQPMAVYLYILSCIQMFDAIGDYRKQRIQQLDQHDRALRMEWRVIGEERAREPELEIVGIAKPPVRSAADEELAFNKRWQKVLSQLPQKSV
jgi:hypothetical protein